MCVIDDVIGFGFIVMLFVAFPEQPLDPTDSVTPTFPVPGAVHITVIEFVPWPVEIVPPVTVHT